MNLKFCVALCNAIWKSYTKNEQKSIFVFLFFIIFLLIRVLPWKIVWCFAMLLKSLIQKMKKIYQWDIRVRQTFLHMRPEIRGTHRSQQVCKGQIYIFRQVFLITKKGITPAIEGSLSSVQNCRVMQAWIHSSVYRESSNAIDCTLKLKLRIICFLD